MIKEDRTYHGTELRDNAENVRHQGKRQNRSSRYSQNKKPYQGNRRPKASHAILPPPSILEAYERLSEGATERLLAMAEQEQKHRHAYEARFYASLTRSRFLGQFLGFLVAVALIAATLFLAIEQQTQLALSLSIGGFAFLSISAIVAAKFYNQRSSRGPARKKQASQRRPENKKQETDA